MTFQNKTSQLNKYLFFYSNWNSFMSGCVSSIIGEKKFAYDLRAETVNLQTYILSHNDGKPQK